MTSDCGLPRLSQVSHLPSMASSGPGPPADTAAKELRQDDRMKTDRNKILIYTYDLTTRACRSKTGLTYKDSKQFLIFKKCFLLLCDFY